MKTRVFKFDLGDGTPSIRFIKENEIQKAYNVYNFQRKLTNEEFSDLIEEYRKERNDEFAELIEENEGKYTLTDVKKFILSFQKEYIWYPDNYGYYYGRPTVFFEPNEEELQPSLDGWYYEGEEVDETLFYDILIEYIEEWNGQNIAFASLCEDYVTELTGEEYEGVEERLELLGSDRKNRSTTWREWYFDSEYNNIWQKNITLWQGQSTDWEIITGDERIYAIILLLYRERDLPQNLLNEVIGYFKDNLKKGEKLIVDNDALCFMYRNEKYHLLFEEITTYGIEDHNGVNSYISIDFNIAREAIEVRRRLAVVNHFAKNNYEKVLELPLSKIYVEMADSIAAGNCQKESNELKEKIAQNENIKGEFACRADVLLSYRDDNYSRRAILLAYSRYNEKINL